MFVVFKSILGGLEIDFSTDLLRYITIRSRGHQRWHREYFTDRCEKQIRRKNRTFHFSILIFALCIIDFMFMFRKTKLRGLILVLTRKHAMTWNNASGGGHFDEDDTLSDKSSAANIILRKKISTPSRIFVSFGRRSFVRQVIVIRGHAYYYYSRCRQIDCPVHASIRKYTQAEALHTYLERIDHECNYKRIRFLITCA